MPTAAGFLALLVGVLNIWRTVNPPFTRTRFAELTSVLPGVVGPLAGATSLVAGVLLIMIAHGLRRRKARAWRLIMVLLPVSALAEWVRWAHFITAALTIVIFFVLLAARKEFYALSDPRTRWRALWALLLLSMVDVAIGWGVLNAHSRAIADEPGPGDRIEHVLLGLFGVSGPIRFTTAHAADLVYFPLAALGALTAVTTLYLALRPERPVAELTPEQEQAVRGLLRRHGAGDSLGYFALRRDKSVIFSPTGKAVIAYRVVAGVMLASGDPIGDVEAWPGAIREFMTKARRHAWVPAVIGCSETGGKVWSREAELSALEIGDEAIVEAAEFRLEGRAMRNVRQMAHRTERAGYACEIRRVGELETQERDRLRRAAQAWRDSANERGFSMALGRIGDAADPECMVATAHKMPDEKGIPPWGDLRAMLHFVPWGTHGLSLDLMRRDRGGDPGLNEWLIMKLLQAAPEYGVTSVSLNFAMFRAVLARGERLGAGPMLRAWRDMLIFLSRWFQIESLYRFNAKFQPRWEPRFLIYPATRDLLRISFAALQAEAFIPYGVFSPRTVIRSVRVAASRRARPP
ncbi:phosphatidylglycerol lysyltransferase domain-containing protein [Nonomuraea sp. M3C6]|uniref:Phosphatidylglycerol lysyltransferase domain-containing protein n=1 Tax=Nonomuraea marmarensis TaxID=3351344 RepID=A0ABW7A9Z8_9ACTN